MTRKDKRILLQLWDLAGQERYAIISGAYYKYTVAAIVVFDITEYSSFKVIRSGGLGERDKAKHLLVQSHVILHSPVGRKLEATARREGRAQQWVQGALHPLGKQSADTLLMPVPFDGSFS